LIDTAQVQLNYATIRSPIDGRVGTRLVDAGNIVRATDATGIVSINQIHPIFVNFSLPSGSLPQLRAASDSDSRIYSAETSVGPLRRLKVAGGATPGSSA
jgi:multidrug efflux system membrane fusion protein